MQIRFPFNQGKAIQAMAYLVDRLGAVDKVKLTKLLYLADRNHFLLVGRPITGDSLVAMPHGPVPSLSLGTLNGEAWPDMQAAYEYLDVHGNEVRVKTQPLVDQLEQNEREALDAVLQQYGHLNTWQLVEQTHQLPEFQEVYVDQTSAPIPYELILKHYKAEAGFRHNRPVISSNTAAAMFCPFPTDEHDL